MPERYGCAIFSYLWLRLHESVKNERYETLSSAARLCGAGLRGRLLFRRRYAGRSRRNRHAQHARRAQRQDAAGRFGHLYQRRRKFRQRGRLLAFHAGRGIGAGGSPDRVAEESGSGSRRIAGTGLCGSLFRRRDAVPVAVRGVAVGRQRCEPAQVLRRFVPARRGERLQGGRRQVRHGAAAAARASRVGRYGADDRKLRPPRAGGGLYVADRGFRVRSRRGGTPAGIRIFPYHSLRSSSRTARKSCSFPESHS